MDSFCLLATLVCELKTEFATNISDLKNVCYYLTQNLLKEAQFLIICFTNFFKVLDN